MLQLEDLIANYPPSDIHNIQEVVTAKEEFREVGALAKEPAPIPGKTFYNNQLFFLRYMIPNDRLLINWQTGTGKTCALVLLAEHYRDLYLKDPENAPINRCIVLVPGPGLKDSFRNQIACNCTSGQYLTPKVLEATRPKVQKANLTRAIGEWYTVETYRVFTSEIAKKSDEELRSSYSRTIIFVDEAHNLNVTTRGDKEKTKGDTYKTLHRLFHLVEGCKIILATATPMINEVAEIKPLMNLLLPLDRQMPKNLVIDNASLEQLEPYFRGLVSYVRSLDTGVLINYVGEKLEIPITVGEDKTITAKIDITPSVMGDIQLEGYKRAIGESGGIYDNERQASNFVFPDRSWGGSFPRTHKDARSAERSKSTGLGKYVTSLVEDNYVPTSEFRDWLRLYDEEETKDDKYLERLSCTYAKSIREVLAADPDTSGTVFVYNDFVFGSGAIVHALAFEANGFERFHGNESAFRATTGISNPCSTQKGSREILLRPYGEKRRDGTIQPYRYALITSDTSPVNLSYILELFSSPENVHGKYLKVLIGSQITREGLNLSHGTQVHLMTTWWNRSANYQAISRILRATSHLLLLEEERRRYEEEGLNPDDVTVPVNIYQHVALVDEDVYDDESIGIHMYRLATTKDYNIRRVERIMKQVAVDCWIHRKRNIRICNKPSCECQRTGTGNSCNDDQDCAPGESCLDGECTEITCNDYTAECDYDVCNYQCFNHELPESTDFSTFDVYYIDEILPDIIEGIINLFNYSFFYSRHELYSRFSNYRPIEIDRALVKIMAEKYVIYDRYGFISYLREDGDYFFLQRDFPLSATGVGNQGLEIYTRDLIATQEISLPDYIASLDKDVQQQIIENILSSTDQDVNIDEEIAKLTTEGRISLLEAAVIDYYKEPSPRLKDILKHFERFLYIIYEPEEDIAQIETLGVRSKGPGRPPKKGTRTQNIKFRVEDLTNPVQEITLDEYDDFVQSGEIPDHRLVFLHTLYNTIFDRVAYNVMVKIKKGDGRLRVYIPEEQDVGWRDVKPNELPVYKVIIEEIIRKRTEVYEQYDFYGIITGKDFRIRDKSMEKVKVQKAADRNDSRYGRRGRICHTFDKPKLIEYAYLLGAPKDIKPEVKPGRRGTKKKVDPLPDTREKLISNLEKKGLINRDKDDVDNWDDDRLEFYFNWNNYGTRNQICDRIREYLEEQDRLLVIKD